MAREIFAITSGQPFNVEQNKIRNSVSGSWTAIAASTSNRAVEVHGVYWSCTTIGATLQISDRENDVWYNCICDGSTPGIDLFALAIPLYTQFEYFDSTGTNIIIIYGTYI